MDLMNDDKEQRLVPNLEERVAEADGWVLYEKPEEIAKLLSEWLLKKFPVEA